MLACQPSFDGLAPRLRRWLDFEQMVNERLIHDIFLPDGHHHTTVRPEIRPESRPIWTPGYTRLPHHLVRSYGPVQSELEANFGLEVSRDHTPLLLHPQATAGHERLSRKYGPASLDDFAATPTSSYRSVLAWSRSGCRPTSILKLSIGARIGGRRRALRENQIARAVLINSLFETIPPKDRKRLRFDWFPETAGAIDVLSRRGWLLRRLPDVLQKRGTSTLLPTFSLISRRTTQVPLLVDWIRASSSPPEEFVIERILEPYVNALAYLLFEHGLQYEGHTQNVLFEITPDETPTGTLVLRDLADTTVNLSFRVAKGKELPIFPDGFLPRGTPFPVAGNAVDYRCNFGGSRVVRGLDTVERYGLWGFVWPINQSLAPFFKRYQSERVAQRYLELWQQAAIHYLGLRPLFRKNPQGLATDEAFSFFLNQTDWRSLGARPARLPQAAEPLLIEGRMRRRPGPVYDRLECAWGDLFIYNGLPGFFRPAF